VTVTGPSRCSETELDSNHESKQLEDGGANNDAVTSIMIQAARAAAARRPRTGTEAEPGSGLGLDTVAHIPCSVTVHRYGNVKVSQ
jgi:hypothetical protein